MLTRTRISLDNLVDTLKAAAESSRLRILATWCSTVLAEMNSWPPMSR